MTRACTMVGIAIAMIAAGCGDDSTPGTTRDAGPGGGFDSGGGGSDGGGSADSGGGGSDGGGDTDGGGGDTDGGGGAMDGGGSTAGVPCGDMTCLRDQTCCVTLEGGAAMSMCIASDMRCAGITLACDGPEDCGMDEVCCAGAGAVGGATGARCTSARMCSASPGSLLLCHTAADCPMPEGRDLMCCPFTRGPFSGSSCEPVCEPTPRP